MLSSQCPKDKLSSLYDSIEQTTKHHSMSIEPTTEILTERNIEDGLKQIIEQLTIISSVSPVGTYKYKVFQYPGDIDLFEKINSSLSRPEFIANTAQRIKTIIQSIILSDVIHFIEFKAGIDSRLDYNLDENLNMRSLLAKLYEWKNAGLITYEESISVAADIKKYRSLSSNSTDAFTIIDKIKKDVREFKMLRWSVSDILTESKQLRGVDSPCMSLQDALNMPTVTKLDTIIWYQNRYVELTNFFYFELTGKNKTIISAPFPDYLASLNKDIKKYAGCSGYPADTLKMLKRMFIRNALLYKSSHDYSIIQEMTEIADIVNQAPGVLSQIKADFEAINSILSSISNPDIVKLCIMLNSMTKRFNNSVIQQNLTKKFNDNKDKLFILFAQYQYLYKQNKSNEANIVRTEFNKLLHMFCDNTIVELKTLINTQTDMLIKSSSIKKSCDLFSAY